MQSRIATAQDIPALQSLMTSAIETLQAGFLDEDQIRSSRAIMGLDRQLIDDAGGYYSYWDTGRRAPLRELLVNEGLAVHASQGISPGHAAWEYFGFGRRQYARVRELEAVISRAVVEDLDRAGLGTS